LIKELTIEPDFVSTSPYCSVEKNGRIHTFRYNSPFSLIFSRLLGFGEWLRLGINGTKLYNATKALPVNNYSAWHQFDNQNCFEWSCDYYGKKITEYIIEPMLEAFYFQKTSETSKALSIALNTFGHNKSKTMTLAEGIAMLPARLSDKIQIIYNSPVGKVLVVMTDDIDSRIPFITEGNQILVELKINHSREEYTFILDTGAG
jgi:oxygen-dependent protoporphyrinogen oxidase